MKRMLSAISSMAILVSSLFLSSCQKNDDIQGEYVQALVTIKYDSSDKCYFQVDNNNVIYPTNINRPFDGKQVRALTQYITKGVGSKEAEVFYLDSVLTKKCVPSQGEAKDAEKYGSDQIGLINDWMTVAEDGYINLHFTAPFGYNTIHFLNLISGVNPDNPYELEFRHNANGDSYGIMDDGIVAFNIMDLFPDGIDKDVTFTIKYNSFEGEKEITLLHNKLDR